MIVLVPANGITAQSYHPLLRSISDDDNALDWAVKDTVSPLERENIRIGKNWDYLYKVFSDLLQKKLRSRKQDSRNQCSRNQRNRNRCTRKQRVLIGHSMGALLSYKFSCENPHWVDVVVMLDPPLFYGPSRWILKVIKSAQCIDRFGPIKSTLRRRNLFADNEEWTHYLDNSLFFNRWDAECLSLYRNSAVAHSGEHLELKISPTTEAEVFRNLPDNVQKYRLPDSVKGIMLRANRSRENRKLECKMFCGKNKINYTEVTGDHMFPLHNPAGVGKLIKSLI